MLKLVGANRLLSVLVLLPLVVMALLIFSALAILRQVNANITTIYDDRLCPSGLRCFLIMAKMRILCSGAPMWRCMQPSWAVRDINSMTRSPPRSAYKIPA